jgi:pyridoxamine 5'-phosphate oxidase
MSTKLSDLRRDFSGQPLLDSDDALNPFLLFARWWSDAEAAQVSDINACALSTASKNAIPNVRMVLIKEWSNSGFDFFTNFHSVKGRHLDANPKAEILFWWAEIARQVRVSGTTNRLSRLENETYFKSRPRESQLAALASDQSSILSSRKALHESIAQLEQTYFGKEIPCPDHWGGYKIVPERIEFWQGQPSRVHDRLCFIKDEDRWKRVRLFP